MISEFERQRQENIQRNKDLLRKLELDTIGESIARDAKPASPAPKKRKTTKKPVKKEDVAPARRSRRLAGVQMENTEEYQKQVEEQEKERARREELEKLRRTRLYGDFSLSDLMTDRLGQLKHEDKVMGNVKEEVQVIGEDDDDNKVVSLLRDLGDKLSAGDFYDIIRKQPVKYDDKVLESKRKEFDLLKIYEKFDPNDIKITHQRITSINFHPSKTDRVIAAGDTNGNVGIWAVDSTDSDEPSIAILRPHGKSIARIVTQSPTQILTASYDGSVRLLDLNKLLAGEVLNITDPYDGKSDLGVSDANICVEGNPNLLYVTTLSGNFYQHDLRTPFKSLDSKKFLRLHDKKIGSFSINPNLSHQIATASLDRSMRIWDLRNVSSKNASWSDFDLDQRSPHAYGLFSSRLSVSCVDWNAENRLVCNGYDDYINLIDLSEGKPVVEWDKNYRPPSKSTEEEEIPDNIKSFTKIKHNCQTGRWVSILKSKWQKTPSDGIQKFCIANMNRGIDIYDQKGQILAHLHDRDLVGAVPAVTGMHPTENWVVGGSASGKVYLFG